MTSQTLLDELAMVRDHINHEHADTVALVARHLPIHVVPLPAASLVKAEIAKLDVFGVELELDLADGMRRVLRHDFAERCADVEEIRREFLSMVTDARSVAGAGEPLTSIEEELAGAGGIRTFLTEVIEVEDLQSNLRRIRFGGGLEDFVSIGGDQFMYVLLPPSGQSELTVGTDFTWEANGQLPEAEQATGAYYSVRAWEPGDNGRGATWIDMWFVNHGHGRASEWAAAASPGDQVALWGPRRTFEPPAETDRYLLVTDASGFGATAALLDELGQDLTRPQIRVVAEAERPDLAIDFPLPSNASVEWTFRDGAEPGLHQGLLDTVRGLEIGPHTYAYGAGESRQVSAIRRYLRDEVELNADQVSMIAYWRRSAS